MLQLYLVVLKRVFHMTSDCTEAVNPGNADANYVKTMGITQAITI